MQSRVETSLGLIILGTVLVLFQGVLLLLVIIKVLDSVPRLDPLKVITSRESSIISRKTDDTRSRTVLSPPAKVDANETTDHVP